MDASKKDRFEHVGRRVWVMYFPKSAIPEGSFFARHGMSRSYAIGGQKQLAVAARERGRRGRHVACDRRLGSGDDAADPPLAGRLAPVSVSKAVSRT